MDDKAGLVLEVKKVNDVFYAENRASSLMLEILSQNSFNKDDISMLEEMGFFVNVNIHLPSNGLVRILK